MLKKNGDGVEEEILDEEGAEEEEPKVEGADDEDVEGEDEGDDTTTDPGKKKEEPSEETDYEAELELENGRAASSAFKKREAKRTGKQEAGGDSDEGEDDLDDDDKPVTVGQIRNILREESERTRKDILADTIRERVSRLAKTDAEGKLIIAIHKNRQWPAGIPLDQQLEESYAIANRKRIMGQNEQLRRALRSKDTRAKGAASAHRDAPVGNEPKANRNTQVLKSQGFKWDARTGFYKKDLASGKRTVFYDAKKDKHWSVKK